MKTTHQKLTIKEFAEKTSMDYLTASAMVKHLMSLGQVTDTGETKRLEGVRGKPSTVYLIPFCVELKFWDVNNPETNNDPFPGEIGENHQEPAQMAVA